MKSKLSKKRIIIIAGIAIAVVAAIVVLIIVVNAKKNYRVIKLEDYEGQVEVTRNEGLVKLFSGLNLISGDASSTGDESVMNLLIDSDKHMLVTENTKFDVKATGSEKEGYVTIDLKEGKAFFEVENKLNDSSVFEVNTPNATTSIRGTKFLTSYNSNENETHVFVDEGTVTITYGDNQTIDATKEEAVTIKDDVAVKENTKSLIINRGYDYSKQDYANLILDYGYFFVENQKQSNVVDVSEELTKDKLEQHSDELNDWFEKSKVNKNSGEYRNKNVTMWFPDEIVIDIGNGPERFKVEKAQLEPSVMKYKDSMGDVYSDKPSYWNSEDNTEEWFWSGLSIHFDILPLGPADDNFIEADKESEAEEKIVLEEPTFEVINDKAIISLTASPIEEYYTPSTKADLPRNRYIYILLYLEGDFCEINYHINNLSDSTYKGEGVHVHRSYLDAEEEFGLDAVSFEGDTIIITVPFEAVYCERYDWWKLDSSNVSTLRYQLYANDEISFDYTWKYGD